MPLVYAEDTASAIADLITSRVDAGSGPGYINVYAGTLPADLDPTGDTLLAEFPLVDPAAAAAVAGVADWDFAPDISDTVLATGTPGYFIVFDSDDAPVFGGDVGTSGAAMNASSTSWVAGGSVSLTTGTFTQPTS